MPIYEYRCTACGVTRDILQKLSDPPATQCASCGKHALAKQVTAAGFQLKGSGWYATDFKNSGAKPAEKSKSSEGGSGGSDSKSSSEGKAPEKSSTDSSSKAVAASAPAAGSSTSE
ncbi:MAG: FmdB family zinc ribbon protein [Burkholderiales bacterium]